MLLACAAATLVITPAAVLADDLQDATQMLRSGQHQQALERINRILAAKPRDAQARFLKGLIFTEQGNTKDAIAIFQKLTEDYPDLPEPYNNLAVIYAAQGQYDKARSSLEQSIRTHPSYATAYENLGDVYSKLASQAYDKALQLDSSNSAAQNKLALVRELVSGAPRGPTNAQTAQGALRPVVVAAAPTETKPVAAAPAKPAAPEPKAAAKSEPKPEPKPEAKPVAMQAKPVPAEKAPEKPAPKSAARADDEILKAVNGWAEAWSNKNPDVYLSFYARDFQTPKGESRAEWEKGRRARVTAPKSISVEAQSPKVTMDGAQAKVRFRQHYKSETLNVNSMKTLVLVKSGAGWRIQQERTGN